VNYGGKHGVIVVMDMACNTIEERRMLGISLQPTLMSKQSGGGFAEERRERIVGFGDGRMIRAAYCASDVIVERANRSLLY